MTDSLPGNDNRLAEFARQFEFSEDAIRHLLNAVAAGGGDMAMFDHPEFAGSGQWMRGGLIMITDSANHVLRNRIDALCNALSDALRQDNAPLVAGRRRLTATARAWDVVSVAPERWWPSSLGKPSATGSQNDLAYAYFDQTRRLAIRRDGQISVYDTGEHRITGISQSQHNDARWLVFTSPLGEVPLDRLERLEDATARKTGHSAFSKAPAQASSSRSSDILETIEQLGELHSKGVLTDAEFTTKKQELLSRL